jgi:hypothetical protein
MTTDTTDITAAWDAYDRLHALIAGYRCTRRALAARLRHQDHVTLGLWFGRAMSGRLVKSDEPADGAAHAAIATSLIAELEQRAAGEDAVPAARPATRFCGACGGYTRCGHEPPVTGPAARDLSDTIQVLWTTEHPHRCGGAPRGGQPSAAEQAEILEALSLATRASLSIQAENAGDLVVLAEEAAEGDEGEPHTWIVGLALHDPQDGWYLGCITCKGEIAECDSAMCQPCRENAAVVDAEQRAAAEAGW